MRRSNRNQKGESPEITTASERVGTDDAAVIFTSVLGEQKAGLFLRSPPKSRCLSALQL